MRIGTRRSALALAQAEQVASLLRARGVPGPVEIVPIVTGGDRGERTADKSRWVAEIERALIEEEVDLAVHSAKDVPGELASGTSLLGSPVRAACEDVLCGASAIEQLAPGARVGTSSLRRIAQLRAARPDLEVVPLRGNVDTRLAKLAARDEALAAIVLAHAGLVRLGRDAEADAVLDPGRFVPAPGQGTLALQGRGDDGETTRAARAVSDEPSFACLLAERALAAELGAGCDTPLGAHARTADGTLRLRAWVGLPDGSEWLYDEIDGTGSAPDTLAGELAERLRSVGAEELLARAREMASA